MPTSIDKVFPFFGNEKNLEQLTPPWLNFKVLRKSTENLETGTLIDYQLKIHGFPVRWRSAIESWVPGESFTDFQVSGPYRKWHHQHHFKAVGGGTLMIDTIEYEVAGGAIGQLLAGKWVARDLERIFEYRYQRASEIFGPNRSLLAENP